VTRNGRLKIAASLIVWTATVYLVGPIITALARASTFQASLARMDDVARARARYVAAERLLDLYDARNPPPLIMYHIVRDYCGYKQPSDDTVWEGLDYLFMASLLIDNRYQRRLRMDRFTATLSDFGFVFLGNCISSTVLAHLCEMHVGHVLERNDIRYTRDLPTGSPDRHEQRVKEAVNCRYLDGVAARAGRPLAGSPN
jgi:hypothetical protein